MSEPDTSDTLQGEIEAAQLAGNSELANDLYLRQIGTEPAAAAAPEPGSDAEGFPLDARALEGLEPTSATDARAMLSETLAGAEALRDFPEFDVTFHSRRRKRSRCLVIWASRSGKFFWQPTTLSTTRNRSG